MFFFGYAIGEMEGATEVRRRDHVQAKAGVFIDGHDKNKVYRLEPVAGGKYIGN